MSVWFSTPLTASIWRLIRSSHILHRSKECKLSLFSLSLLSKFLRPWLSFIVELWSVCTHFCSSLFAMSSCNEIWFDTFSWSVCNTMDGHVCLKAAGQQGTRRQHDAQCSQTLVFQYLIFQTSWSTNRILNSQLQRLPYNNVVPTQLLSNRQHHCQHQACCSPHSQSSHSGLF